MFSKRQPIPRWLIVLGLLMICLVVVLMAMNLLAVMKPTPGHQPSPSRQVSREVLAFYYGWYATPQVSGRWLHWSDVNLVHEHIGSSAHYPLGGPYDSHDPRVVEHQCELARQVGITGFIVSWWGPGSFEDQGLPLLLQAAERNGLKVTIYDEVTPHKSASATAATVESNLLYVLHRYAGHPAWLRASETPVIFIYGRVIQALPWTAWSGIVAHVKAASSSGATILADGVSSQRTRVFDGLHTYNIMWSIYGKSIPQVQRWAAATYSQEVRMAGHDLISCVTVTPGYDDRSQTDRPLPRPVLDRHDGATYRVLWSQAIAAHPDWILITSWNEWHEGTEIEPSKELGETALRITQDYAHQFLGTGSK